MHYTLTVVFQTVLKATVLSEAIIEGAALMERYEACDHVIEWQVSRNEID